MDRVKEEGFAEIPLRTDVSFWFHLALVLTFFTLYYIAANAPLAVPVVFGRYSYPWFAVQVWNIAAFSLPRRALSLCACMDSVIYLCSCPHFS